MKTTPGLDLDLPADYKPSPGELDNLVYLTCKYTIGWPMRQADLAVVLMMAGGVLGGDRQDPSAAIVGPKGIDQVVWEGCEYCWDHIAGEPEEPTPQQLFDHLKPMIQEWYKATTPQERAKTS